MTVISEPPLSLTGSLRALRSMIPTLLAVFAIDAMTALVVIGYGNTYLITTLNAPASYPAYALAVYGLVKLVSAPAGGWVLDHLRTLFIAAASLVLELAGLVVILGTKSADGYLVGVGLMSTGIALSWLIVFHVVGASSDPSGRGPATAYMGLTSVGATASGFGLAAVLGETRYWQAPFAVAIVLALAASVAMIRLPQTQVRLEPAGPTVQREAAPARRNPRRFAFLLVLAHFGVITAALGAFGPFALRTLDLSLLQAGIALGPAGIAGAGAMYLAGHRSRHGRRLRELAALYVLGAAATFAMAATHNAPSFALMVIPFAVCLGGVHPLMNASLLDAARSGERSGTALGWLFFAEGLGSVIGPVAIGAGIDLAGVRAALAGLGVAVVCLAFAAGAASRFVRL